jgi:hypothetical protein
LRNLRVLHCWAEISRGSQKVRSRIEVKRCGGPAFYNASIPTRPRAPARPAPIMPVGMAAPAEELEELLEPVGEPPVEAPPRVLGEAVDVAVVLLLPVTIAVELDVGGTTVVFESAEESEELTEEITELAALVTELMAALVAAGTRYVLTLLGRAANQDGVAPAANSDAMAEEAAAEFVRASSMREEGSAVWRTEYTEALSIVRFPISTHSSDAFMLTGQGFPKPVSREDWEKRQRRRQRPR